MIPVHTFMKLNTSNMSASLFVIAGSKRTNDGHLPPMSGHQQRSHFAQTLRFFLSKISLRLSSPLMTSKTSFTFGDSTGLMYCHATTVRRIYQPLRWTNCKTSAYHSSMIDISRSIFGDEEMSNIKKHADSMKNVSLLSKLFWVLFLIQEKLYITSCRREIPLLCEWIQSASLFWLVFLSVFIISSCAKM